MNGLRKFSLLKVLACVAAVVCASIPVQAADDLQTVLSRLDATSKTFTSAQANISWQGVQVNPVPDTDTQLGTILFAREGGQMQVALHIASDNGKPYSKDVVYSGGEGKMYEPAIKQLQVYHVGDRQSQLNSLLTLGFGGSGADLQKSWNVQYIGSDPVNGTPAAKLQLTPKDPSLAKSAPKVLLWIDLDKGVAVKQQRYDSDGNYLVFSYTNIKLNAKVPAHAFEIKTASGTQIVNH